MPFDRDSFLKGVITGMRLPRTPGGQRPFPPVPPGRYILTESGEHILTELESETILEFGATNVVYNNPIWSNSRVVLSVSDGKTYSFFGAYAYGTYRYVLISRESFVGKTITYFYSWGPNDDPTRFQGEVSEGPIEEGYIPSQGGAYFMYVFTSVDGYPLISTNDMTYFRYSSDFVLVNLVANISSSPLITEGG